MLIESMCTPEETNFSFLAGNELFVFDKGKTTFARLKERFDLQRIGAIHFFMSEITHVTFLETDFEHLFEAGFFHDNMAIYIHTMNGNSLYKQGKDTDWKINEVRTNTFLTDGSILVEVQSDDLYEGTSEASIYRGFRIILVAGLVSQFTTGTHMELYYSGLQPHFPLWVGQQLEKYPNSIQHIIYSKESVENYWQDLEQAGVTKFLYKFKMAGGFKTDEERKWMFRKILDSGRKTALTSSVSVLRTHD